MILACDLGNGQPNPNCGTSVYYNFFVVFIVLDEFLSSALALFSVLVDTFLTFSGYSSLVVNLKKRHVCLLIFIVSFAAYTPTLFMYEVHSSIHRMVKSSFGKTPLALTILTLLNTTRITLTSIVLGTLNLITKFKFRAHLRRKSQLTAELTQESPMAKMKEK